MNNSIFKLLGYTFFGCIVLNFILKSQGTQEWVSIVTTITTCICVAIALVYVWILLYCVKENKMIDNYLNNDEYEKLIAYASKKEQRPFFLLSERKGYYKYLILLSNLGLNDIDGIEKSFETFERYDSFPISLYWKASYEISKGQLENVEDYYNRFINSPDIRKKAYQLRNIVYLFEAFKHYSKNDLDKVEESVSQINTDSISIPCSIKSINILKETLEKYKAQNEVQSIESSEEIVDIE